MSNTPTTIEAMSDAWLEAKAQEHAATERRRVIEDAMLENLKSAISEDGEGALTIKPSGYAIKITQRITRTVDADLIQELAADSGLSEHLSSLFRWKPELNKRQWDNAADNIRAALSPAITAKPGRPSFSITKE